MGRENAEKLTHKETIYLTVDWLKKMCINSFWVFRRSTWEGLKIKIERFTLVFISNQRKIETSALLISASMRLTWNKYRYKYPNAHTWIETVELLTNIDHNNQIIRLINFHLFICFTIYTHFDALMRTVVVAVVVEGSNFIRTWAICFVLFRFISFRLVSFCVVCSVCVYVCVSVTVFGE